MLSDRPDCNELHHAAQAAMECSDSEWYRYTLKKDVCGCRLSQDEERAVLTGAVQTASDMARQMVAQFDVHSPQELAAAMEVDIFHAANELREPFLFFGLYEPASRTITLNDSAIALVQQFIDKNGLSDLTPLSDVTTVALYHELFHALEETTPGIYTRSCMLDRKLLGLFPRKRGLAGVSEVGAVHFSKCMAGIAYSPCILERYLLLALGRLSIDFLLPSV